MPSVSLCMIVRDEAAILGPLLEAAGGRCRERLVLDTGSKDHTVSVAQRSGATVWSTAWNDDFAAARNQVLERARADWILVLDADEAPDWEALDRRLAALEADADGYVVDIWNYGDDPGVYGWRPLTVDLPEARGLGGYVPTAVVRLFRNDPRWRYEGRVHELVEPALLRGGGHLRPADVRIHHYGRALGAERLRCKAERYLALARAKAAEQPGDLKAQLEWGSECLEAGRPKEAREAFERAARCGSGAPSPLVAVLQATALHRLGQHGQAVAVLRAAAKAQPRDADLKLALAHALRFQGDAVGAETRYRELEHNAQVGHQALFGLSEVLLRQGRGEEALEVARTLRLCLPRVAAAAIRLGAVLLETGRIAEARQVAEDIRASGAAYSALLELRGMARYRSGDFGPAAEDFRALCREAPEDARAAFGLGLCLERLGDDQGASVVFARADELRRGGDPAAAYRRAHALLRLGRVAEALTALEDVVARAPRHARAQVDLGGLLGARGELERAQACFERALELDERDAKAHHNLAVILLSRRPQDMERARAHADRARALGAVLGPELEQALGLGANDAGGETGPGAV